MLDKCWSEPCENGGTCETVAVDEDTRYFQCTCEGRYTGPTCLALHPPCFVSPCGEHGICVPEEELETCMCDEGFTGQFCESNIDDCEGDPCKNGGTCLDKITDFSCDCAPGDYRAIINCLNRRLYISET